MNHSVLHQLRKAKCQAARSGDGLGTQGAYVTTMVTGLNNTLLSYKLANYLHKYKVFQYIVCILLALITA